MIRFRAAALALTCSAALAACSTGGTGGDASSSAGAPSAASTAGPTDIPTALAQITSAPPLGPDVHCMDAMHCYASNPKKLDAAGYAAYLRASTGGDQAPRADQRPWAFVVNGLAENEKITAHAAPDPGAAAVPDPIGILDHRVLFAYCRVAQGGGAVSASTPAASVWYRVQPITDTTTPTWVDGSHLVPYQHDGAIPAC